MSQELRTTKTKTWDGERFSGIDNLQACCDETVIKLANAKIQSEDLKHQFGDALAAEHMLERLTERNLVLGKVRLFFI